MAHEYFSLKKGGMKLQSQSILGLVLSDLLSTLNDAWAKHSNGEILWSVTTHDFPQNRGILTGLWDTKSYGLILNAICKHYLMIMIRLCMQFNKMIPHYTIMSTIGMMRFRRWVLKRRRSDIPRQHRFLYVCVWAYLFAAGIPDKWLLGWSGCLTRIRIYGSQRAF